MDTAILKENGHSYIPLGVSELDFTEIQAKHIKTVEVRFFRWNILSMITKNMLHNENCVREKNKIRLNNIYFKGYFC